LLDGGDKLRLTPLGHDAGATRAAENGAPQAQLKAMLGWTDDNMPSLCTKTAERARMAASGMSMLEKRAEPEQLSPHPVPR